MFGARLSILLPCKNEAKTLRRQLDAIYGQIRPQDEVVMLDDASTDDTLGIMREFARTKDTVIVHDTSAGVCEAFNACAFDAGNEWILGASGNDCVLPGTVKAFEDAETKFPYARVMFGHIKQWNRQAWRSETGWIPQSSMLPLWTKWAGHRTHGAAAFLRRDSWGDGYLPKLEWMADWFQTLLLAMRHGCVFLDHVCSDVFMGPGQFSSQHGDVGAYNRVIDAMKAEFESVKYGDVRELGRQFHKITGWLNRR